MIVNSCGNISSGGGGSGELSLPFGKIIRPTYIPEPEDSNNLFIDVTSMFEDLVNDSELNLSYARLAFCFLLDITEDSAVKSYSMILNPCFYFNSATSDLYISDNGFSNVDELLGDTGPIGTMEYPEPEAIPFTRDSVYISSGSICIQMASNVSRIEVKDMYILAIAPWLK